MEHPIRKILSLLLALSLALVILYVSVMAADGNESRYYSSVPTGTDPVPVPDHGTCGENLTWDYTADGTLTISGTGPMTDFVDIYDTPWNNLYGVKKLVFEEGITHIGNYAFKYLSYDYETDMDLVLPDSLISIGNSAFSNLDNISSVHFGSNLESIGDNCFEYCYGLRTLNFPASLKQIGNYVFTNCTGVTRMVFNGDAPAFGTSVFYPIASSAFYPANNATWTDEVKQNYGGTIKWVEGAPTSYPVAITSGDCGFNNATDVVWTLYDNGHLTVNGSGEMVHCGYFSCPWYSCRHSVRSASFGEGVINVGSYAFYQNYNLESVTLSSTIKEIETEAFSCCTSLTSVKMAEGLLEVGDSAFDSCEKLTNVNLPSTLTTIGSSAFRYCYILQDVTFPQSLTSIGESAFSSCGELTKAILPDSLITIGENAFYDCYGITEVTMGDKITSIGDFAFSSTSIESIVLPADLETLGIGAFYYCYDLKSVTLNDKLTTIGTKAFTNTCITYITIPASVKSIETRAFSGCYNMNCFVFTGDAPTFGEYALPNYGPILAYYPAGNDTWTDTVQNNTNSAITWVPGTPETNPVPLASGTCNNGQTWELNMKGELLISGTGAMENYDYEDNYAPWSNVSHKVVSIVVSDGITSIGDYAFECCYNAESLHIGKDVDSIGIYGMASYLEEITVASGNKTYSVSGGLLFNDTQASVVYCCRNFEGVCTIPEGIVEIGSNAFVNCTYITGVNFPATTLKVIGDNAFAYCSGITSITMPGSVTTMEIGAFSYCNSLETVTLSKSLTKIPTKAFYCCYSLSEIVIPASVTTINSDAFYHCGSLESIVIPETVTTIKEYAFNQCYNLSTITFPGDAPNSIGMGAFSSVSANVYYPANNDTWTPRIMLNYDGTLTWFAEGSTEGVYSVTYGSCGPNSYMHLNSDGVLVIYGTGPVESTVWDLYPSVVTSVVIENGIISIPDNAFADLPNVTEITLPQSIKYIGSNAFGGSGVTAVTFLGDAPVISSDSFSGVTATVSYPAGTSTWTAETMQNYGGQLTWTEGETKKSFAIVPLYPSMALEDEVKYNIYFSLKDQDLVSIEEMGLLTFLEKPAVGGIENAYNVIPGATFDGSSYMVTSNGIPAKELGDSLYFQIYVKLADGSYVYTKAFSFNAVSYVKSVLASNGNDSLKKVCVSLMNYGASAQVQFGYKTDALMNSFLTAEQKALVSEYSSDMTAPIVKADSSKAGPYVYTSEGFSSRLPSVSLEGAFALNYYFVPAKPVDTTMILYYWTAEDYQAAATLAPENASGSIVMGPNEAGQYWADCSGIAAKELDETLYVTAVYQSGGETYCSGVLACTVSALCGMQAQSTDPAIAALAEDILVYGHYAKSHFGA